MTRTGSSPYRKDHPLTFYPIYVSEDGRKIVKVGDPIGVGVDRKSVAPLPDTKIIWPIRSNGEEGRWQLGVAKVREAYANGYVRLGKFTDTGMAISYLAKGEQEKIARGEFKIIGHRDDGSIIVDEDEYEATYIPGSQWWIKSHDATQLGTKLLQSMVGSDRFSFPKSLYAVHDAIRFFVANKPNALIVDFFAGSGTTLHAVNLLNAEDGGKRRCILVTNNEVSDAEEKEFRNRGLKPGDAEWEAKGIAQYVTWPRTTCSIKGVNVKGEPLKGEYITAKGGALGDRALPVSDGFKANAKFFKLEFVDKDSVRLGRQFKGILPILWMRSGAKGKCPQWTKASEPEMMIKPENGFAVLVDYDKYAEFIKAVNDDSKIKDVYFVTDSEDDYREMCTELRRGKKPTHLYHSYLENFVIGCRRNAK